MITFFTAIIFLIIGFYLAWVLNKKGKQIPEDYILFKERCENLNKELQEKCELISKQQDSLIEFQERAIRFQTLNEQDSKEIIAIKEVRNNLENKVIELNKRVAELEANNQNLNNINNEKILEINNLMGKMDKLTSDLQNCESSSLKKEYNLDELEKLNNRQSEVISEKDLEIKALKENKEILSNELIDNKTRLSVTTEARNQLNQQLQEKNRETESKQDLLEEMQQKLAVISLELAQKNTLIKSHDKICEEYELKLDEIKNELTKIRIDNEKNITKIITLSEECATKDGELKILNENANKLNEQIEKLNEIQLSEFKVVANEILEEKTKKFTQLSEEKLSDVLKPFKEGVDELKKKVEDTYNQESKERNHLEKEIARLVETTSNVSKQADNLTNALKYNNKQQGSWGEMILESILENAGLIKGKNYFIQEAIKDNAGNTIKGEDGGALIPDVTILFPNSRKIIIDSKVSLIAFERYVNCSSEEEKRRALNEHIASKKTHILNFGSVK